MAKSQSHCWAILQNCLFHIDWFMASFCWRISWLLLPFVLLYLVNSSETNGTLIRHMVNSVCNFCGTNSFYFPFPILSYESLRKKTAMFFQSFHISPNERKHLYVCTDVLYFYLLNAVPLIRVNCNVFLIFSIFPIKFLNGVWVN